MTDQMAYGVVSGDHELEGVQHFLNCNCARCRELFDQDEENALNPDPEVMGEQ